MWTRLLLDGNLNKFELTLIRQCEKVETHFTEKWKYEHFMEMQTRLKSTLRKCQQTETHLTEKWKYEQVETHFTEMWKGRNPLYGNVNRLEPTSRKCKKRLEPTSGNCEKVGTYFTAYVVLVCTVKIRTYIHIIFEHECS